MRRWVVTLGLAVTVTAMSGLAQAPPASQAPRPGSGPGGRLPQAAPPSHANLDYAPPEPASLPSPARRRSPRCLVFPKVKKAGLMIGGQYGEGALLKEGKPVAYYKTTGVSYGLQAGGQQYGYAMFFMNQKALDQLDNASGFEVGVGPSLFMVDEGMAKTTTTNTLKDDIYAFVFGQKGLMAGLGLQGNKIAKITPK